VGVGGPVWVWRVLTVSWVGSQLGRGEGRGGKNLRDHGGDRSGGLRWAFLLIEKLSVFTYEEMEILQRQ
jgi:hypothetical protein